MFRPLWERLLVNDLDYQVNQDREPKPPISNLEFAVA
jgi:hypothetical protein